MRDSLLCVLSPTQSRVSHVILILNVFNCFQRFFRSLFQKQSDPSSNDLNRTFMIVLLHIYVDNCKQNKTLSSIK